MPRLTDTQLVILSAAAQRDDGAVLPLPKSIKAGDKAAAAAMKRLLKAGLLAEQPASRDAVPWREAGDGRRLMLVITAAGLEAIGVEPDQDDGKQAATSRQRKKRGKRAAANGKQKKSGGTGARPTPASPKTKNRKPPRPAVRPGTKQALLIDLLKRRNGATIDEAVEATGWQAHSVRGAISGALKKKLGLSVTSELSKKRGRVYRIVERG